jgi:hypothetical protein
MTTTLRCACCRRFGDEIAREDPRYVFFPIEGLYLCTGCLKLYRRWRKSCRVWYRSLLLKLKKAPNAPPPVCTYLEAVRTGTWRPSEKSKYARLARLARARNE